MAHEHGDFNFDNPFAAALEEIPEAAFQSSPGGKAFAAGSPAKARFFEGQFQNVFNKFLGQLGEGLRAGEVPEQTFTQSVDAFDFEHLFRTLPPSFRGFFQRQLAPQTRFLTF